MDEEICASQARLVSRVSRTPVAAFVVALGLGVGKRTLELSDLLLKLTDHAGRAGSRLRVGAAPFLLFRFADGGLDGAQAALDAVQVGGGHAADLFPAVLNLAQLGLRRGRCR